MFKVLASRIVIFTVAILWVMGWLSIGFLWWEVLVLRLVTFQPIWVAYLLQIWYAATIILVGVWVVIKGLRFVGHWEQHEA